MTTPIAPRIAGTPSGALVASGVSRMIAYLSHPDAAAEFSKWSGDRMTVCLRNAIRDLAFTGPANLDVRESAVQYGITLGLALADRILTDPSSVYSGLFGTQVQQGTALPQPDYETTFEDVLDGQGRIDT